MAQPPMTEDQRLLAVALLANAIRKERRLGARSAEAREGSVLLSTLAFGDRSGGATQYVRGMRDLLAVLFDGGRTVSDTCYETALREAEGPGQRAQG